MNKNLIGLNAGKVWQLLNNNKRWSYSELKEAVGLSDRDLNAAIGWLARGDKIDFEFNLTPRVPKPVMRDILDEEVADKYTLSDKLWTYLQNYAAKHRAAGNGFGYGIAPLDGVSRTLSARYYKDGSEVLIAQEGKNPRRLTPRECARLQGFPDTFKIPVSDTQAYKQFGNSVVVPLMGEVAKLIVNNIETMDNEKEQDIQRKVI